MFLLSHDDGLLDQWGERKKRANWYVAYIYKQARYSLQKYVYGGVISGYIGGQHQLPSLL